MRRLACALLAAFILTSTVSHVSAKRVALIVGNSSYKNVSKLANPSNDARAMSDVLMRLGFEVVDLKLDQDFTTFRRTLRSFSRKAAGADMGLVFYAGHGIEVGGQNYLIPVDAELSDSGDVDFEAIPLSMVMSALDRVKKLKLIVLDACRDNPFRAKMKTTGATRSIGRGLARVTPRGQNSLIAYAAREGTVAGDGDGKHSPYVTALLTHIETPGLEINILFRKVRDAVMDKTGGRQEPFVYGSLSAEAIYLKVGKAPPKTASPNTATHLPLGGATLAWEHVKDSDDVDLLRAFIAQYGASNAFYARLAESRIAKLQKKQKTAAIPPNTVEPPQTVTPSTDPAYKVRGTCKNDIANWRAKASIGAFAVERGGGCGWSYGFNDLAQARERAIAECHKQGPDCKVVAVHTDKTGDWTLGAKCKTDIENWRKKASIGAFAVEQRGGCGWSYGFSDVAQARERAIAECKKQGPACKVIEVHTDKSGNWTLGGNCKRDLESWRKKASIAAFAVERRGGCGWSWGNKTVKQARTSALKACSQQGPECRVIEVHTKQRGDYSLSSSCQQSIAKWRKLRKKGAFAVERGGGCGWSYGFNSVSPARSRAIVECRKQGPDCRVVEVR